MDYSEQLYQELLKMRILGKNNYDEEEKVKQVITDTMYEIRGYKVKEEGDTFFSKWTQRVCPQGYWSPGMK
jgi:hypothetical protein